MDDDDDYDDVIAAAAAPDGVIGGDCVCVCVQHSCCDADGMGY